MLVEHAVLGGVGLDGAVGQTHGAVGVRIGGLTFLPFHEALGKGLAAFGNGTGAFNHGRGELLGRSYDSVVDHRSGVVLVVGVALDLLAELLFRGEGGIVENVFNERLDL